MSTVPSLEPALATLRLLANQASSTHQTSGAGQAAGPNQTAGSRYTRITAADGAGQNLGPQPAGGFAAEMRLAIQRINALQIDAVDKGKAFQAGDPNITLNDLMIDVQKASVAFEFGKSVRNRLVNAYQEVMRMQV
ncbi:MAG: flagellar hook-basal body complex protein FliE [Lamprobacter sp.]|uniref:flagellar hook-basal body complex protein FliE n=1 Tax=Lamprobacter sp. TaxID=3100796 RepID=UPI002B2606BC|nr:flagellar hook-basal body complex protein FliE [Lamprobacter sp.]MEA3640377.1 flagellar hook-basal body complex protein FliE [Lamprobacter sp.]